MKFYDFVQQNKFLFRFFHRLAFDISISNNLSLGFIDSFWGLCGIFYAQLNELSAEGETVEPDKEPDIIITGEGSMFLNGTPFPADAENLRAIIIEKTGSRRDIPIFIVVNSGPARAMVVMSMDTVSQLRLQRLSISTQRPSAGE